MIDIMLLKYMLIQTHNEGGTVSQRCIIQTLHIGQNSHSILYKDKLTSPIAKNMLFDPRFHTIKWATS